MILLNLIFQNLSNKTILISIIGGVFFAGVLILFKKHKTDRIEQ